MVIIKNTYLFLILILILLYSCKNQYYTNYSFVDVGCKLVIDSINKGNGKIICYDTIYTVQIIDTFNNNALMITPSVAYNLKQVYYDSIVYNLGLNENNIIKRFTTCDENFISPENVKVGTHLDEIKKKYKYGDYYYLTGWGYYQDFKSGWTAYFPFDENNNSMLDSTVTCLIKQNRPSPKYKIIIYKLTHW